MNKAVFIDRDGVINELAFNPNNGEFESPHYTDDFVIFPWVIGALKQLLNFGYKLFLVSNQPSFAKGKTSLENIKAIHNILQDTLSKNGVSFSQYYYCYHHPEGIIPEYTCKCECRKPGTLFVAEAKSKFDIDLSSSWFIGDQDTDILCGINAGLCTIAIENPKSAGRRGSIKADYVASDLVKAAEIILRA